MRKPNKEFTQEEHYVIQRAQIKLDKEKTERKVDTFFQTLKSLMVTARLFKRFEDQSPEALTSIIDCSKSEVQQAKQEYEAEISKTMDNISMQDKIFLYDKLNGDSFAEFGDSFAKSLELRLSDYPARLVNVPSEKMVRQSR